MATQSSRMAAPDVPLLRALSGEDVTAAGLVISRPGAAPVEVSCNARALMADDGTPLGAVVAMTNVTTDRAQRRELEQAHADLAAAVTELRRSNEELESFAGAVSHDLLPGGTVRRLRVTTLGAAALVVADADVPARGG